ncbi:unnamed protein product [Prorocentrum cordatum]|uniref:EF-hand domain-containing protein n=1 Tax=Prorocentrum cordatum TaxID=2364126 RepID=A0ABN9PTD1_9DINO|nr:unnamed protein product [Polarella glacialis]
MAKPSVANGRLVRDLEMNVAEEAGSAIWVAAEAQTAARQRATQELGSMEANSMNVQTEVTQGVVAVIHGASHDAEDGVVTAQAEADSLRAAFEKSTAARASCESPLPCWLRVGMVEEGCEVREAQDTLTTHGAHHRGWQAMPVSSEGQHRTQRSQVERIRRVVCAVEPQVGHPLKQSISKSLDPDSRRHVGRDGKRKEREARKNEEEALKKRIKDEVEAKEAAQKARAKEIADRQQEEINKRQEHVAALKARKMLQRLHRPALPDNISKAEFEKLVDEVRNAIEDSSEEMGSLAENMREQCEKAVAEAETRVFRCDALAKERAKLADDADCKVSEAQRALQALSQQTTVEDPAEMLERVMHAEGAVEACSEALEAALKDLPSAMAELGPSERTILWEETGQEEKVNFRELNSRMTTHKLTLTKLRMSFKTEKERVTRRAQALANERKLKDKFKLYDRGGKGHMDKADVAIMAGAEFQCELSGEQLDNLFRTKGAEGLSNTDWQARRVDQRRQ